MNAKVLTPKKVDLLFFTLMFSIAHLCFFILTPTKTYNIIANIQLGAWLGATFHFLPFGAGNGKPKDTLDASMDIIRKIPYKLFYRTLKSITC